MINDLSSIAVAVLSTNSHEPYHNKLKERDSILLSLLLLVKILLEVLFHRTVTAAVARTIKPALSSPFLFLGTGRFI
jgi:hypothetical protein